MDDFRDPFRLIFKCIKDFDFTTGWMFQKVSPVNILKTAILNEGPCVTPTP